MSDQTGFRRNGTRGLALALGVAVVGVLAPASPASAAVPGLVRISATSASNSSDFRSVTATCPVGKVLVGTGYEITGATGEVVVDDFTPNGGTLTAPTAVTVGAYEADAFAGNWTVTAYAICANPLAGLVRVSALSPTDSNDFHSVTAACPTGKVLTGAGFELTGVTGEGVVDDFRPNGGTVNAPTAVTVGAYEADSFVDNWTAAAYAICANPVAGLSRITVLSAIDSGDFRSVVAACPTGKVLTGGGFEVNGATGEAVVDDFTPNGGVATAPVLVVSGAYEEDPFAGNWDIRSFAICADR
ncbi:hypothetical protein [Micromonospora sagamiensis]|uniref:Uncharacterized protein n=1 Tax=Micromonospora sagamiensis TaxID=47875 RepID=A0A562WME9_9ACTN|nr:hypothetical protein [Micromonospora sagamiensis]TWJ31047.1 hypothetical protein JD81_04599 [Micromonospora sagamiensis]BCL15911.1 hypothetical protein GCM10017556_36500 [Micromonospora sagamiensis]